jgi:hypothetical protein
MALWSNTDANTSVPKFAPSLVKVGNSQDNSNLLYGNTTTGAFITGTAVGVFGVDATEQGLASNQAEHAAHAGWVLRKKGKGAVSTISAGATNKSNVGNSYITFTGGGTGNTSANAQLFVNATSNVVTTIVLNTVGLYETTPTATVAGNANVTITLTMGGRANRNTVETLVAMGSMTGDGSASANDDTVYADS